MSITAPDFIEAHNKLRYAKQSWQLLDDGEVFKTHSSLLQPVIYRGIKAMLKIPIAAEESRGSHLMVCWDGNGAAKVLHHDGNALLMERAVGTRSLKQMVIDGDEDEANRIICGVVAKLHATKCEAVKELIPLPVWFHALKPAANRYGGILVECNTIANLLLNDPVETVVLHGDIHYENILDSGTRGWVAIDPKALLGERGFDFANIFCNPDFKTATSPDRLSKQVKLVAAEAGLDAKRLLNWIIAWSGLSAAWAINDGEGSGLPMKVAEIALNELNSF
jgi:streptomycin 6-kinase